MKYLGFLAVFIIISSGAGWVTLTLITHGGDVIIPDVTGRDLASAIMHLQESKIYSVIDREESHASIPRGFIVSQSPPPGENRKRYSTVQLVISSGPDHIDMPDLSGFGIRQARIQASQLGFGAISEILLHDNSLHEGEVIAHSPGPSEIVLPGAPVKFLVSLGEKPIEYHMPDFIGQSVEVARKTLGETIYPEIIISQVRMQQPGIIISQTPKAGELLTTQDRVTFEISPENSTDSVGNVDLFSYHVPVESVAKQLQIEYVLGDERRILRRITPVSGETISVMISKTGDGRIEVYLDSKLVLTEKW